MTASPDSEFSRFTALSFDCYGTLIDWETGLLAQLSAWNRRHALGATDDELLEAFARNETVVQQAQPRARYPEVLAETLRRMDEAFGAGSSPEEVAEFAGSVGAWPAFSDTADALRRLKQHYRLIILSNIDRATFATSLPRLGVDFDLVVTAEDVGAYKPSPASFPALLEAVGTLGVEPGQLLHVAESLYHDHTPAKALGLSTVWIDRRHDRPGHGATAAPLTDVQPDWRYTSMAAFADDATAAR